MSELAEYEVTDESGFKRTLLLNKEHAKELGGVLAVLLEYGKDTVSNKARTTTAGK